MPSADWAEGPPVEQPQEDKAMHEASNPRWPRATVSPQFRKGWIAHRNYAESELQEARKRIAELEFLLAANVREKDRHRREKLEALDLLERLLVPAAMLNEPLKLKRNAREILARNGRLTEGDVQ